MKMVPATESSAGTETGISDAAISLKPSPITSGMWPICSERLSTCLLVFSLVYSAARPTAETSRAIRGSAGRHPASQT
jgi:hypothetical protein